MPILGITRDAVYVWLRHPWWPWPWNLIFSKRNDQSVRIKHEVILTILILTNTFPCSSVPPVRLYPPFLCYSLSTKPQFLTHENESMTDCISDVRSWMISDNLMLNDDKTEFLILGTKQQLTKVNIDNIKVGSANVSPVPVVRNLGSWFDSQLTMSSHISKLCSVAFYHLYNIRRIRKYLSQEATATLVHAFITSRTDYCNSLLYGLPDNQLVKIQRVLNAAARLVCNAPRFCHITPIMRDLHWLPIRARINFKVLLLTFKALHGLAPQYLQSLISIKTSCYNLRGSKTLLLAMPSVKSKATLWDRAFAVAAPSLWNSLPSELRSITCVNSFKARLKTYLFRHAYTWWRFYQYFLLFTSYPVIYLLISFYQILYTYRIYNLGMRIWS